VVRVARRIAELRGDIGLSMDGFAVSLRAGLDITDSALEGDA